MTSAPNRLRLDGAALAANWRVLNEMSGSAAAGAAVKADGYGVGAPQAVIRLANAGCRDFFVASWAEAAQIALTGLPVAVLHGVREDDLPHVGAPNVRPVLNTLEQVARWRGRGACDVMVDTGMNRLGLSVEQVADGALDGLQIDTLLSHLSSADDDSDRSARQLAAFAALAGKTGARRLSLANSAGIALGADYAFDLTRPGIALYGGVPRPEFAGRIRQVVMPEAQVLQVRTVPAGETVGYSATWTAPADTRVAIVNMGYADGYLRCFSDKGSARMGDAMLAVLGRVSMDLIALDATAAPDIAEGDWIAFDYALPETAARSGLSQYELLTGLGRRFDRVWTG